MEAPQRVMHLSLSVEDRNGNKVTCPTDPSPDSLRTTSSLSHGSTDSPDDVEMAEDCISEVTLAENIMRKVVLQTGASNMVDYLKNNNDNCNQNMTILVSDLQNGSVDSEHAPLPTVCGPIVQKNCKGSDTHNDYTEQEILVLNSVKLSQCDSDERCSSVSSSEMVIRSNSFLLTESEPLLSVSLLEESSDILSDSGLKPALLPDVCKGLVNDTFSAKGKDITHQELGVTFIQSTNETFIMEEDVFQTASSSLIPQRAVGESKSSHLIPGVDRSECVTPVNFKKSKTEALRCQWHTGGSAHSTPPEGKTYQHAASEELDISGNVQTSTPVQSLTSKTFCCPSFSDSSLSKRKCDLESPMGQVFNKEPSSVSQKPKTHLTVTTKSHKPEIKKFARPDFSNVKSKVASRNNSAFKAPSVSAVKCSPNASHQVNKNQTTKTYHSVQHKTPVRSTVISSNSTVASACNSLKKPQSNVSKRVRSSTCQEGVPSLKSRLRTWSETSKATSERSYEKETQVSKILNAVTTETPSSSVNVQHQPGRDKPPSSVKEKQTEGSLSISRKPQKTTLKVSKFVQLLVMVRETYCNF